MLPCDVCFKVRVEIKESGTTFGKIFVHVWEVCFLHMQEGFELQGRRGRQTKTAHAQKSYNYTACRDAACALAWFPEPNIL